MSGKVSKDEFYKFTKKFPNFINIDCDDVNDEEVCMEILEASGRTNKAVNESCKLEMNMPTKTANDHWTSKPLIYHVSNVQNDITLRQED